MLRGQRLDSRHGAHVDDTEERMEGYSLGQHTPLPILSDFTSYSNSHHIISRPVLPRPFTSYPIPESVLRVRHAMRDRTEIISTS